MAYSEEYLNRVDRLVAEKVMGWRLDEQGQWRDEQDIPLMWDPGQNLTIQTWRPTRDRGQALMVFERCEDMELDHAWGAHGHVYRAKRIDPVTKEVRHWDTTDAPMLAICFVATRFARTETDKHGGAA